jgi:tetratricopeptide (TPR) repeat protein
LRIYEYYRRNGTPEQALQSVDYGLSLHPDNTMLRFYRTVQLVIMDRFDEAEQQLAELENIDPKGVWFSTARGALLAKTEKLSEALDLFSHIMTVVENDQNARAVLDYHIGYALKDARQYTHSKSFFEDALTITTDDEMIFYLGCCHAFLGEYHKAEKLYKKMLRLSPYSGTAWANLANMYMGMKKYEKAADAFEYALAIMPDDEKCQEGCAHAYYQMGVEHYKKADPKEASKCYHKAYELHPDALNLTFYMAMAHYRMGESVSAGKYLKEAIDKAEDKGKILNEFVKLFPQTLRHPKFFEQFGFKLEFKGIDDPDKYLRTHYGV